MSKKKLGPQAPVGFVWCKAQWVPSGRCLNTCWRRKRCVALKAYKAKEAEFNGSNIPKGKGNKGK